MYVVYDKKSDWEVDYIRNDILHGITHTFLPLSREELETVEIDHPEVVRTCILVFSSNNYQFKDVLRIVKAIKPNVILHLSDEQGRKEVFGALAKHTKLYVRNYNYTHYNLAQYTNVLQFPLGYTSGYISGQYSLDILPKPLHERQNKWAFVGKLKQDRQKMLRVFQRNMAPYDCRTDGNVSPQDMFQIYNNSVFVPCGRGNMRLECFRLYEVVIAGAIPVVVGTTEEIAETFLYNPPFLFATSWEEAEKRCRQLLDSDELKKLHEAMLIWWKSCIEGIQANIRKVVQ